MDDEEVEWLNSYHQRVAATIGPLLQGTDQDWLRQATQIVGV
jgi:Xaa-Pro aminopeptidase